MSGHIVSKTANRTRPGCRRWPVSAGWDRIWSRPGFGALRGLGGGAVSRAAIPAGSWPGRSAASKTAPVTAVRSALLPPHAGRG